MEEDKKIDSIDGKIGEEFLMQLDKLQMSLIDIDEEESGTKTKLAIAEEQHAKSLDEMRKLMAQKDAKIKGLEMKLHKLDNLALNGKLMKEEFKRNFQCDIERFNAQIKIYQKEGELLKEQARNKIIENLKLEAKVQELEAKIESMGKMQMRVEKIENVLQSELEQMRSKLTEIRSNGGEFEKSKNEVVKINQELMEEVDRKVH